MEPQAIGRLDGESADFRVEIEDTMGVNKNVEIITIPVVVLRATSVENGVLLATIAPGTGQAEALGRALIGQ